VSVPNHFLFVFVLKQDLLSLYNIRFNLKNQQKIKAKDFGSAAGMKLLSEVETNELCANF